MLLKSTFKSSLGNLLFIFTILLSFLTFAGFFVYSAWFFDQASHFRAQYFFLLVSFALIFSLSKRYKSATVAGIFALVNLYFLVPFYFGGTPAFSESRSYRVATVNLDGKNQDFIKVQNFFREVNPDIFILQEFNEAWRVKLESLLADYPFSIVTKRSDGWGQGLYSRFPVTESKISYLGDIREAALSAKVDLDGTLLKIVGVHLADPSSRDSLATRNNQLEDLADLIGIGNERIMVLGDMNLTSWSLYFDDFIQKTGLLDTRIGRGLQPTWPANFPFLWIPIDHCLVSSNVIVRSRRVGPYIGSDHYPVIVDFSINS